MSLTIFLSLKNYKNKKRNFTLFYSLMLKLIGKIQLQSIFIIFFILSFYVFFLGDSYNSVNPHSELLINLFIYFYIYILMSIASCFNFVEKLMPKKWYKIFSKNFSNIKKYFLCETNLGVCLGSV
jgi:Mn2+/Fe2+ NRAMP family transporter